MPQHYYQQSSAWNHVNKHTYKKHTGAGIWGALISAIIPHKPKPKPQEEEGEGFADIGKWQTKTPERGWPTKGKPIHNKSYGYRYGPGARRKTKVNRKKLRAAKARIQNEARRMRGDGGGFWSSHETKAPMPGAHRGKGDYS